MSQEKAVENEKLDYLKLLAQIEEKKYEYKTQQRPLILYRNLIGITLLVIISAITVIGLFDPSSYVGGWAIFILIIFGISLIWFIIYFFIDYDDGGDTHGFQGIGRLKNLINLHEEIEGLEIQARVLKNYQTYFLSVEEQSELYKDELFQAISQYQRKANQNRWMYFTMQIVIIACSLFVGGLTSGLTNLISIFGSHWLAPLLSFIVSFLTAMVTLFRPRERSYNLQQTADAIQYEIACANRHIYGYKNLSGRELYTRLAEEVEKLRNEQRKRQQQLEQASEVKQATD